VLIWGIMHFRQYLHRTRFTLRTDHKPLEWLAMVSDASGRKGRWIHLLQDFDFKIVHRPGLRHTNVDALSRNPVGKASEDDDLIGKFRMLGLHEMTQVKKCLLFGVINIQTGLDSGGHHGNLPSTRGVVPISIEGMVWKNTSCSCWMWLLRQARCRDTAIP